jgi:pimeloyl-ACP methyl ester carboxylesterase
MHRFLAALVLTASLALPSFSQTPSDRGRPVVLLLHGRGMIDRDTAGLRQLWFNGLSSGEKTIMRTMPLAEGDVRLVWYADVLDLRSTAGCDYARNDLRARHDASADPDMKSLVSVVGGLLGAMTGLVADTEASVQLRSLAGDAAFLSDARKRCATEQRLAEALERARSEGRPVILVAHSLGSLVAYDYLSTRADTGVIQRLVTVGSPIGSPDIRRLLIGGDPTDTLAKPPSVAAWINVRNGDDPLATSVPVARELLTTTPAGETDPHEMVGYLRGTATANAILGGWCAAFVSTQPAGCAELGRISP